MKLIAILILTMMPSMVLAQIGAPSGVVTGASRNFSQDRDTPTNLTAAPIGTARDRLERQQRQQSQRQNITGTGRPVAAPPAPTPMAAARPVAPAAPARPVAPPAAAARPATPAAVAAAPGPARPGATILAPADGVRSGSAVPSLAGQSTGAARGTPASR
jgi:hypothetical protein